MKHQDIANARPNPPNQLPKKPNLCSLLVSLPGGIAHSRVLDQSICNSMNAFTLLRGCYAMIAVVYSFLGVAECAYAAGVQQFSGISNSATAYEGFYLALRVLLASVQFWVHGSLLFSMRYYTEAADRETARLLGGGSLPQGITSYYDKLKWCNIALGVFICLGIGAVAAAPSAGLGAGFQGMEVVSILLLLSVLIARLVAITKNTTRQWFFCAWSSKNDSATLPVASSSPEQH